MSWSVVEEDVGVSEVWGIRKDNDRGLREDEDEERSREAEN